MGLDQNIKVAVDAVVFTKNSQEELSILLIKRKGKTHHDTWALPGGFVEDEEPLELAAKRELKEETGIIIQSLEQLYTFGEPDRDPRSRVISVSYYGFIKSANLKLKANSDASDAAWFNINKLPELAFDHKDIIQVAIDRMKEKGE